MTLEKQLADYGQLQEELFGAIEVDEITNPLTEGRQERTPSSQTLFPQRITRPTRHAGPAWAVAAFVSVLAVGAAYLLFSNPGEQVADNPPPPTTVAPDVETMTDLQIIEAGVAALYSGDAEHAIELFELPDGDDAQIRQEAAYQAAIGGRLTLDCTEENTPGVFTCNVSYHNDVIDAVGYVDSPGDTNRVVVQEGVITEFPVPEHDFLLLEVGTFLREQVQGHESCGVEPRTPECANLIMDHLDEWADWCGLIVTDYPGVSRCVNTPENGQPVTELPQSDEFLDGEVTFGTFGWGYSFAGWDFTPTMETLLFSGEYAERVALVADPLPVETGCEVGPAPADAEALAESIRTDPDLEVSEPVTVSVGGIEGIRMDVVAAPGASNCDYEGPMPAVLAASTGRMGGGHQLVEMPVGSRMRLYLLDLPEEISAGILAIAIAAPESRFDHVVELAAPIVDSVEFHSG